MCQSAYFDRVEITYHLHTPPGYPTGLELLLPHYNKYQAQDGKVTEEKLSNVALYTQHS